MASTNEEVDPFPLLPAIWTDLKRFCGSPKAESKEEMLSSPRRIPKRSKLYKKIYGFGIFPVYIDRERCRL